MALLLLLSIMGLLTLFLCLGITISEGANIIDLGGVHEWHFSSSNGSISGRAAAVPGDIYADLQAAGIIEDPLYGKHNIHYAWVGRTDWSYSTEFELGPGEVLDSEFIVLHAEGLDTVADVYLNERLVLEARNQFLSHLVDVKFALSEGINQLRIDFQSPVDYAAKEAENYERLHSHGMPPSCPPEVYDGECHMNMVRKVQASFSWDWGPSFPTVGIWRSIYLEYFNHSSIESFSPVVESLEDGDFLINASAMITCSPSVTSLRATITLPELSQLSNVTAIAINCSGDAAVGVANRSDGHSPHMPRLAVGTLRIPRAAVELWYPNGYGAQRLYDVNLILEDEARGVTHKVGSRIGFRTIRLVQDLVDDEHPNKGRHFYFTVNSIPIFLKGSNWVPVSAFPARNNSLRLHFYFHSMRAANFNALRVWGGGLYEGEEFYRLADEAGLLLWHDLMFACAAYSADDAFLQNVRKEVEQQLYRLRGHPSILVWAGNNENELGVAHGWFNRAGYRREQMHSDYVRLYADTIAPLVKGIDPSRPYLLSSPSNGVRTEEEGGLSAQPDDPSFGDIHFYAETSSLWQDGGYQIPRCSSEYGLQSLPSLVTLAQWLPDEELHYGSEMLMSRQHKPGGAMELLGSTFQHFDVPKSGNCSRHYSDRECYSSVMQTKLFLDDFCFLSQLQQAVAVQSQSEHYRRWRGRLTLNGLGNTMCAMYWQLNDVWAAPSWSSIDYSLNWKMLHYFMGRSFAPLIISMYRAYTTDNLELFIVSDLIQPLTNASLKLEVFVLGSGSFDPIYTKFTRIERIPALSSTQVEVRASAEELPLFTALKEQKQVGESVADYYLIEATLLDGEAAPLAPQSYLLPDKLYSRSVKFGGAVLKSLTQLNETRYQVGVIAENGVVPSVWLDLIPEVKQVAGSLPLLYHFSENGFPLTSHTEKRVTLAIFEEGGRPKRAIKLSDISLKYLL